MFDIDWMQGPYQPAQTKKEDSRHLKSSIKKIVEHRYTGQNFYDCDLLRSHASTERVKFNMKSS